MKGKITMEVAEIKKVVTVRPFKPFEIHLDNGEVHKITHPEIIVSNTLVMTIDEHGDSVLIAPEAVTSIKRLDSESMCN